MLVSTPWGDCKPQHLQRVRVNDEYIYKQESPWPVVWRDLPTVRATDYSVRNQDGGSLCAQRFSTKGTGDTVLVVVTGPCVRARPAPGPRMLWTFWLQDGWMKRPALCGCGSFPYCLEYCSLSWRFFCSIVYFHFSFKRVNFMLKYNIKMEFCTNHNYITWEKRGNSESETWC